MALTSTLFTGLSGLDVNQTRLNVVGNNIANVNTVAFKSSRALFKPQFYVTDSAGTPAGGDTGGSNPSQRGLGAVLATIQKDFTPGAIEPTGKPTDIAIDGDGFFVVQGKDQKFTRDGSFSLNDSNQLVTTSGDFVQGFGVDKNANIIPGKLQNVTIPIGSLTTAKATEDVKLEGNLNASGVIANGASVLNSTEMVLKTGSTYVGPLSAAPLTELASSATPATALFNAGDVLKLNGQKGGRDLEESTFTVTGATTLTDFATTMQDSLGVDTTAPPIPGNPTPGVTIDPSGAGVMLTITGNTGIDNAIAMTGSSVVNQLGNAPMTFLGGTNSAGFTDDPAGESVNTSFVVYDSLGTPLTVNVTATMESKDSTGNTWRFYAQSADDTDVNLGVGNGTLKFDTEGKLLTTTGGTISIDRTNTGSGTPLVVNLDFGAMTSLTSSKSDLVMTNQDGTPIGTLDSFSIGGDGRITGSFSNGQTQSLGQLAMATFPNNEGLTDDGGNMYRTGPNSGVPIISTPMNLGGGALRAGALELSNVDLSKEFTNMIISSTGFSAASRVISTSDQLLTDLLNSTR